MSSKNLKVYRIQFITEVKQMQFQVKFPCQIKMIWKRSNEVAETSLKPVENGIVNFNETLKMYINMYFDTNNNKFVEKKCLYSFLIITEKGEKSAGTVTIDLSQFFNKRIYQLEQQFPLLKCPLQGTKIKMKIYYEQATQTGYDSMSKISTSSQMDISTGNMEVFQVKQTTSIKPTNDKIQPQPKKPQQQTTDPKDKSQKQQQTQNFDLLNDSDIGQHPLHITDLQSSEQGSSPTGHSSEKISENIQALTKITGKINDFVSRCSGNIKNQIEGLKNSNKKLEEKVMNCNSQITQLLKDKQNNTGKISELEKQLNNAKITYELQQKKNNEYREESQQKYEQSQKICKQLQKNLQEKGSMQTSYVNELKQNNAQNEKKLKDKLETITNQLAQQKKQKYELANKINLLQHSQKQLKQKLQHSQNINKTYEAKQTQRQKQLTQLRYKLQNAYELIVKSFGSILQ